MIQASTADGDSLTPNLDTENAEITLRYNTGIRAEPGYYMPETTMTFNVGYFYDL